MFWCRSLFLSWVRSGSLPFASLWCRDLRLPWLLVTSVRACFQVGWLPVAAGSFPLLPGPQIAWLLVTSVCAFFQVGWLCFAGGRGLLSFGAGTSDCLAVGTCLRAFFQVGLLPVAVGSFPLLPGPHFAWLLVTSVCAFFQVPVAASSFLLLPGPSLCLPLVTSLRALFQVGWLRSTGGRELLPVAAGTSLGRFKSGGSWSAQLLRKLLWNIYALDFGWVRRRSMPLVAAWWRTTDMCTSAWSWALRSCIFCARASGSGVSSTRSGSGSSSLFTRSCTLPSWWLA